MIFNSWSVFPTVCNIIWLSKFGAVTVIKCPKCSSGMVFSAFIVPFAKIVPAA